MHVVEHDLLEGVQEILLEIEGHEFFTFEEFVSELSQTVDSENGHHEVGMGADPDKVG